MQRNNFQPTGSLHSKKTTFLYVLSQLQNITIRQKQFCTRIKYIELLNRYTGLVKINFYNN